MPRQPRPALAATSILGPLVVPRHRSSVLHSAIAGNSRQLHHHPPAHGRRPPPSRSPERHPLARPALAQWATTRPCATFFSRHPSQPLWQCRGSELFCGGFSASWRSSVASIPASFPSPPNFSSSRTCDPKPRFTWTRITTFRACRTTSARRLSQAASGRWEIMRFPSRSGMSSAFLRVYYLTQPFLQRAGSTRTFICSSSGFLVTVLWRPLRIWPVRLVF